MELKHIVRDRLVRFVRLRKGFAVYAVDVDEATYEFPVALDDIGDATLLAQDKALLFMRYIRRSLSEGSFVRKT